MGFAIGATVAGIGLASALTCYLACDALQYLPVVADPDGGYHALTTSGVGPALIALNILSLAILCWTTKLRSVLQLWLGVSLFLLLLDNLVTDLGAMRMTVGWFLGRVEALLAGFVVLGIYLTEGEQPLPTRGTGGDFPGKAAHRSAGGTRQSGDCARGVWHGRLGAGPGKR